jgi:hypothetical protein
MNSNDAAPAILLIAASRGPGLAMAEEMARRYELLHQFRSDKTCRSGYKNVHHSSCAP